MAAARHDPDPQPSEGRPDEAAHAEAEHEAARRVAAAQRWLIDELRDECSDIGVSARGFDLDAFTEGAAVFAREALRLGAPPERMLVLLKQCLTDEAIPRADRERYQLYVDVAVRAAVRAYFPPAVGRGEARAAYGAERAGEDRPDGGRPGA